MIELASLIDHYHYHYHDTFMARYGGRLLPVQQQAIDAIRRCRTPVAGELRVHCTGCEQSQSQPLSCGHRRGWANVKLGYGAESALGVKGITFIECNKPGGTQTPVASDKHEIFFMVEEVFESDCRFVKIKIERLNTNGIHDFSQQLANHHGNFLRVVGSCSMDCDRCVHSAAASTGWR